MGMFISSLWADFPQNGHGDVMMIGQFTSNIIITGSSWSGYFLFCLPFASVCIYLC
jgi:hypothetical protein